MKERKDYSKPLMNKELFIPQEAISACWKCVLRCEGTPKAKNQHPHIYVFDNPPTGSYRSTQMIDHNAHDIGTFKVISDTDPGPEYFAGTLGEFSAIVASQSAVAPGQGTFVGHKTDQYTPGYAWTSAEWNYCFAQTIEWVRIDGGPNAS